MSFLQKINAPIGIVGIGEAMIEFAPVPGGWFRRGFAGDTLNTSWYLRKLLPAEFHVSYATRAGVDALSDEFASFLVTSGLTEEKVARDPERTLGLYTITLEGSERRFSYWRENSAARRLADDAAVLAKCFADVSLIYLSGITLAIIGEAGRDNLHAALKEARTRGTRVAFDSNIRLRLWPDERVARQAIERILELSDVALPSFDDEATFWKDRSPEATARRLRESGAGEIVVKNGAGTALVCYGQNTHAVDANAVTDALDTTAAGDSFNAAYLAARCAGIAPEFACEAGHALAGEVVRHPGALAPREAIEPVRKLIEQGYKSQA